MNILEARRRVLGGEVYKKTAEGNPVSVRSLARMRPGLKLFGRSEQFTTTGAQLLNIPDDYTGETNGVTWSANGGVIHVSGTAISGVFTTNVDITDLFEPEQDYYISNNVASESMSAYLEVHYADETPNDYIQNNIYTAKPNIEKVIFYINVLPGATVDADVYPMLNTGSTAKPWEPYTGGQPSPSPDYPQEITSVGDDGSIQVDITGAQLLDAANTADADLTVNGVTITNNSDGSFTSSGTPTNTDDYVFTYYVTREMVLEDGQYVLTSGLSVRISKKDGTLEYKAGVFTFNSETDESISIYMQRNLDNYIDGEIVWPMLNKGSTALPWEPYKQPQSLTVQTPNGLPGIPVSSGGNYTDESGQQWVSDEVNYRRRKYVRRIGIDNLRDCVWSVSWNNNPDYNIDGTFLVFTQKFNGVVSPSIGKRSFCTHFRMLQKSMLSNPDIGMESGQGSNFNIAFRVPSTLANSISEWEQWLQENDVVFTYVLATPIETDLSQEQLSAYANLNTNRPTTVVSATDGAGLEITYKTKKSLEVT